MHFGKGKYTISVAEENIATHLVLWDMFEHVHISGNILHPVECRCGQTVTYEQSTTSSLDIL